MSGEERMPDAEVDRQFAEIIDRFYSGGGPQGGGSSGLRHPSGALPPESDLGVGSHPLFDDPETYHDPLAGGDLGPSDWRRTDSDWLADEPVEPFVPAAPPPLPRLSTPALVGSLMLTTSILICLLAILGLPFPAWAGWLAITGFAVGMALLLSRLPHHRDPEDGDGAVL